MPSRYTTRNFCENSYYHVYNRGVEKRQIFLKEKDYHIFLYYLYIYVANPCEIKYRYPKLPIRLESKNLFNQIQLICFCLMPNHFHLLLFQKDQTSIPKLIKQVTNAYTYYFNKEYDRVGGLFQDKYKSVRVETDEQLLHLSRYIHLNPLTGKITKDLNSYPWSSYQSYVMDKPTFCKKEFILNNFSSLNEYEKFVLEEMHEKLNLENLLID